MPTLGPISTSPCNKSPIRAAPTPSTASVHGPEILARANTSRSRIVLPAHNIPGGLEFTIGDYAARLLFHSSGSALLKSGSALLTVVVWLPSHFVAIARAMDALGSTETRATASMLPICSDLRSPRTLLDLLLDQSGIAWFAGSSTPPIVSSKAEFRGMVPSP